MCLIALSLVFISGRSYSVIRLKVMDGINAPTYFSLTVDREETVGDIGETASKSGFGKSRILILLRINRSLSSQVLESQLGVVVNVWSL